MQLTTDLTADSYQQQAGRTLISTDTVPTFPAAGLYALTELLRLAVLLAEQIDTLKKDLFHEHAPLDMLAQRAWLDEFAEQVTHLRGHLWRVQRDPAYADHLTRDGHSVRRLWNAVGLVGEAGEVAGTILDACDGEPIVTDRLIKELGDVAWYSAALCSVEGLPFSGVLQANLDKLAVRYPAGWSTAASKARPDASPPPDRADPTFFEPGVPPSGAHTAYSPHGRGKRGHQQT